MAGPPGSTARGPSSTRTDFVRLDFELSAVQPAHVHRLKALPGLHVHPFSWGLLRKSRMLFSPFVAATFSAYAAGAYGLAADDLEALWDLSPVYFNLGITVFVLGFGFAPILLALVSELYGRYWVFVGSGSVFFLGTMGCAITQSFGGILACRLVTGCGASVFATLTGGVVGDLFRKEERNAPMALYSLAIMAGTGIGPLVSGAVVDHLSWRWIFYLQMILIGLTTVGLAVIFRETRANVLLNRNCKTLNAHLQMLEDSGENMGAIFPRDQEMKAMPKTAGDDGPDQPAPTRTITTRFRTSDQAASSVLATVGTAFRFPLVLLMTESIVFWFSAWVSFAWAILYMQFSSISLVYRNVHGFQNTHIGAVYTAVIVGSTVGCLMCLAQDRLCHRYFSRFMDRPESRLYLACVSSFLLPAGLFWFGWTARQSIHWIVPTLAIGTFEAGIFVIYLAVFNYFVDSYGMYASSALAAQSLCRNLLAGVFPLFTRPMLNNLGYGPAGSLLGGIGLALCLVPWVLIFYGEAIRRRSAFMQQLNPA